MNGAWYKDPVLPKFRYLYNGKELNEEFGLNFYDYGARWYDAGMGSWWEVDPLAEKTLNFSPYSYGNDNPINMVDRDGRYAVSVHYQLTYNALISKGYSHTQADKIAHMASTYADHPSEGVRAADHFGHNLGALGHLAYRKGIDYSITQDS